MKNEPKISQNKKEIFLSKKKSPNVKVILSMGVVLVAVISSLYFFSDKNEVESKQYFGDPIVAERSYLGDYVDMKNIEPEINDTQLVLPLDIVDADNIVYFESQNKNGQTVPLMAYITPTGRLFVGSSMCEPCRGTKFSLAGQTLVCNTCRTTYDIETHSFISGSSVCGSYPPVNMNPTVEGNNIIIDKTNILNWEIRG